MSTTLHDAQERALEAAENKGHEMMMWIPAGYVHGTKTECAKCGARLMAFVGPTSDDPKWGRMSGEALEEHCTGGGGIGGGKASDRFPRAAALRAARPGEAYAPQLPSLSWSTAPMQPLGSVLYRIGPDGFTSIMCIYPKQ